ncbi:hypothetical protein KIN20_001809 [Parelaphostrongylus tenuis]|uniref:Uncharacterized protein n=1 Tax=Parelaphostrongylus tenuis TaxID=148309 RepID=A0AAD5QHB9_PARTN|nr:hypothetical protein KIN20_001809 [Parelaphostrongylus tenuis]
MATSRLVGKQARTPYTCKRIYADAACLRLPRKRRRDVACLSTAVPKRRLYANLPRMMTRDDLWMYQVSAPMLRDKFGTNEPMLEGWKTRKLAITRCLSPESTWRQERQ